MVRTLDWQEILMFKNWLSQIFNQEVGGSLPPWPPDYKGVRE